MKVISIKEPFASLIASGIKSIETRSWNTNYRGEILIHASLTKDNLVRKNGDFLKLVNNLETNPGYILCKAKLVDSIYMTNEFIEKIKNTNYNEYLCGRYEVNRYAFVLEDIKPITPVKAKGQLGIWNYNTLDEVLDTIKNISYDNREYYNLKTPKEVLESKRGICFDQVELERSILSGHDFKSYLLVYYNGLECPSHTFIAIKDNNKFIWLENAFERYKGIYIYHNLKDLLIDVRNKFIKFNNMSNIIDNNLCLYEYKKPNENVSILDFYKHCESGINIDIDNL